MFWRQIPRATDVLSNRTPTPSGSPPRSVPPRSENEDEPQRLPYSSRNGGSGADGSGFDGRSQWKKAIERVKEDERCKQHGEPLRTVRDVVHQAVAQDKDKRNKFIGLAGRLRRRSSAARMRRPAPLDLEDDAPDPVTLAKITPFESSPPGSLCGDSRREPDIATTTDPRSSLDRLETRRPPSAASISRNTLVLPAQSSSIPRSPRVSPPVSFDDEDDESSLPPYQATDRVNSSLISPGPPTRSNSDVIPNYAPSRPELDRRATLAAASTSLVPLPPLPPPPARFPLREPRTREILEQNDEGSAPSYSSRMQQVPRTSAEINRRRSTASLRSRSERVPYHELFGISGLTNLGNSCYMSAVIQSLAATDLLADFLSSGQYRREINRDNRNGSQGRIAQALSVLFGAMLSGQHRVITPGRFRNIISSASQFDNDDQQDAHDFLLYLLDAVHEDLNLVLHPKAISETSTRNHSKLERMSEVVAADQEWALYRDQNDSIIIDFFQGQLRNRMECLYCHETSTTYNPLQTIPLSIPDEQSDIPLAIEDCIDEFLREEILDEENAWNCPRCLRARTASKQLTITRLPQILIIQLKRFTSYSSFASKVETAVDFPLDRLELGYLLPAGSTSEDPRLNLAHETNTTYELYAVVNHIGGENTSGHYTATVRIRDTFLEIDDEKISAVPATEVVERYASSAYLLFYHLGSDSEL